MDVHTREQRSYNMSRIRGKNTKPEKALRQWLWAMGYRYRLCDKTLPGKPDIVFKKKQKVIFVHGCFWHLHRCRYFHWPKTNAEFWKEKISENAKRDQRNYAALKQSGWQHLVIWECDIKNSNTQATEKEIIDFLGPVGG